MLYRPAFCCNCGEKIVREEWKLWTSRRFCALCSTEHQGADLLPKVVVGFGLLAIVFAVATIVKRPGSSENEVAVISQQSRANLKPATLYSSNTASNSVSNTVLPGNVSPNIAPLTQINEQPQNEKRTSDETVYYCGAITKKGTPCTRRVKTKGFCWQHAKSGQMAPARF